MQACFTLAPLPFQSRYKACEAGVRLCIRNAISNRNATYSSLFFAPEISWMQLAGTEPSPAGNAGVEPPAKLLHPRSPREDREMVCLASAVSKFPSAGTFHPNLPPAASSGDKWEKRDGSRGNPKRQGNCPELLLVLHLRAKNSWAELFIAHQSHGKGFA